VGSWAFAQGIGSTLSNSTLIINPDSDHDGALDPPGDIVLTVPLMCNYSALNGVKVEGGPHDGFDAGVANPPVGFTDHVDYQAALSWAGIDASTPQLIYTTNGDGTPGSAQGDLRPSNADATLRIFGFTAAGLLLAGDYTDTVTVTIGTQ